LSGKAKLQCAEYLPNGVIDVPAGAALAALLEDGSTRGDPKAAKALARRRVIIVQGLREVAEILCAARRNGDSRDSVL